MSAHAGLGQFDSTARRSFPLPGSGGREDADARTDPANPWVRPRRGRIAIVNNVQKESVKHHTCFDVALHLEVVARLCAEGPCRNFPVHRHSTIAVAALRTKPASILRFTSRKSSVRSNGRATNRALRGAGFHVRATGRRRRFAFVSAWSIGGPHGRPPTKRQISPRTNG